MTARCPSETIPLRVTVRSTSTIVRPSWAPTRPPDATGGGPAGRAPRPARPVSQPNDLPARYRVTHPCTIARCTPALAATSLTCAPVNTARTTSKRCSTTDKTTSTNPASKITWTLDGDVRIQGAAHARCRTSVGAPTSHFTRYRTAAIGNARTFLTCSGARALGRASRPVSATDARTTRGGLPRVVHGYLVARPRRAEATPARPSRRPRLGAVPGLRSAICGRSRRAVPVARCVPLPPTNRPRVGAARSGGHGYLVAPTLPRRALPHTSGHLPQRTRTARSTHVYPVACGESYTVRFVRKRRSAHGYLVAPLDFAPEGDVGRIAEAG